jgi:hypothetical protein
MSAPIEARRAKSPFQFVAASYLTRIGSQKATCLGELAQGLRTCPEDSIFHHTFQSLETHHYTSFSNDFAQWALTACNEAALAEQLAVVDLRDVVSLADLRASLVAIVDRHLEEFPVSADRRAMEAFYFCEAHEMTVPFGQPIWTLEDLAAGIRLLGHESLHYHFINSRLRLHLRTNDFSHWILTCFDLPRLAAQLDRIDFYNDTLDDLRQDILALLAKEGVR